MGAGGLLQPVMESDWPLQRLGPAGFSVAEQEPLDLMSQVQPLVPWAAGSRPVPGPSGEGAKASGHLELGASRSGSGTARGASCTCPGQMCTWPARGPPPPQRSRRTAARQAHLCLPRVWRAPAAPRVGGGSTGERRGAEGPRGERGGWGWVAWVAPPSGRGELVQHHPPCWGSMSQEVLGAGLGRAGGGRALSGRPVCPSACTAAWGLLSAAGVGGQGPLPPMPSPSPPTCSGRGRHPRSGCVRVFASACTCLGYF